MFPCTTWCATECAPTRQQTSSHSCSHTRARRTNTQWLGAICIFPHMLAWWWWVHTQPSASSPHAAAKWPANRMSHRTGGMVCASVRVASLLAYAANERCACVLSVWSCRGKVLFTGCIMCRDILSVLLDSVQSICTICMYLCAFWVCVCVLDVPIRINRKTHAHIQ